MAEQSNTHAGHSQDLSQTPLDADQHGQSQNILDETKQTFASQTVDKNIGSNRPEDGASGGRLSDRVDDLLTGSGGTTGAENKAKKIDNEAFRLGGEETDPHNVAAAKQP